MRGGFGLVTSLLAYDDFLIDPLPNLLFTRDSSVWVRDRVAITSLAMPARKRETELTELIYSRHPRFVGTPRMHGAHLEHVEGGDVLLLAPGVIAVGVGERTTPAGVERLARQCFAATLAHTVLAVPIAQERATMHLDTICTLVDVDKMVVYPNVADSLMAYTVRPSGDVEADGDLVLEVGKAEPFLVAAAEGDGHRHAAPDRHRPRPGHRRARAVGRRQQHPGPRAAGRRRLRAQRRDQRPARGRRHRGGPDRRLRAGLGSRRPALHELPDLARTTGLSWATRPLERGSSVPSMRFGRCLDSPGRFGRTAPGGPDPERLAMADTFFSMFTPEEIALISASGTRVTLPEGWAPISESTGADKAYIILSGQVSVRSHGDEVAQLGPGDIVGEAAILNHSLRTATIVALTPLELIHFTKEQLAGLNVEMPSFHEALEKTAAERFPPQS